MGVCKMPENEEVEDFSPLLNLPAEYRSMISRLLLHHFKEGFMVAHTHPDMPVSLAYATFFYTDTMRTFLDDNP